ncbi:alpha/beta hydrolase [Salinirubellus salinus]|uniref:Alpha/beta hydrolase n=1 Tax=Salinirubellus salinus TaxID=1364945 RepID=A0A9E7R0Y7_9EURY|nr:alpha/beta hydrolase [Salinirubellus salinus]UWM53622.1 alpha/beta hydrolase [Salinirubellus salinus]
MTDTPLDPALADVVSALDAEAVPPWSSLGVESARRLEDELFSAGSGPEMDLIREFAVPGEGGELPLRLYRPPDVERPAPALVFAHGGGWTLGTLDSADDICRELAARVGCTVVSVDYRLAPEHPFPAPLEDVRTAATWVREHAESLGVDTSRLGLAGTSAGGNLAAATALYTVSEGGDPFACQVLLYPITDCSFDTDSYREHADGPLLTRTDMEWFWAQYRRTPADAYHPLASVLRAPDAMLDCETPAVVATGGHDPLRDEGRAYAERLREFVDCATHDVPALAHGFCSLTDDVPAADETFDAIAESVRERL